MSGRIHSTDLLCSFFILFSSLIFVPGLQAHKKGLDIFLAFNDEVVTALQQACERDFDNEAMTLLKATRIIRRDMLDTKSKFNGTFNNSCQQQSVPESLKTLIGMILGGPDINTQSSDMTEAQTSVSISQLMLFNATKRHRDSGTTGASYYHSRDREPPLPIYLGLMTHAEMRKRTLVDKLSNLGLSISYDRVLELSTDMGNSVCARFEAEGVVCPPKLLKGVFTTAAVDNIYHNPSSVTAQGAFHGTGISLFQHPTSDSPGEEREVVSIDNQHSKTKRLARLPDSYTAVRPIILPKASQSCQELLKCGCKSERGCAGRCKCVKAELPCTALCNCAGLCDQE